MEFLPSENKNKSLTASTRFSPSLSHLSPWWLCEHFLSHRQPPLSSAIFPPSQLCSSCPKDKWRFWDNVPNVHYSPGGGENERGRKPVSEHLLSCPLTLRSCYCEIEAFRFTGKCEMWSSEVVLIKKTSPVRIVHVVAGFNHGRGRPQTGWQHQAWK